eukprot:3594012-Rhodomonas_salina.1
MSINRCPFHAGMVQRRGRRDVCGFENKEYVQLNSYVWFVRDLTLRLYVQLPHVLKGLHPANLLRWKGRRNVERKLHGSGWSDGIRV